MKRKNWLWMLLAAVMCGLYACSDDDCCVEEYNVIESSPNWATEGGYKKFDPIKGKLSQEAAWELVKEKMLNGNTENMAVYISSEVISAHTTYTKSTGELTTPHYSCWLIFIDDAPYQNWSHNCRYVFVKTDGSIIKVEKDNWAIDDIYDNDKFVRLFVNFDSGTLSSRVSTSFTGNMNITQTSIVATNRYAVIISGGANQSRNFYRYWNNCSAIYNVLRKKYGYPKENIKTFISDGYDSGADRYCFNTTTEWFESSPTDLDQDGIDDVTGAATLNNIRSTFSNLQNSLTYEDELFIFITSHGAYDGKYYTTLWGEELYADELQSMLSGINANNIQIISTVCNSGGFIPSLEWTNRAVGTACRADENSRAYETLEFDTFPYYWISAMLGQKIDDLDTTVNCDSNDDSKISFYEAFEYAKNNAEYLYEHAQYSSTPSHLGNNVGLEEITFTTGALEGDSYFCNQAIYHIPNLPSGASVTWNVTLSEKNPADASTLTSSTTTHTGSSITLTRQQDAAIYNISATIFYNSLQKTLSKTVLCNGLSPYTGTLYWESGFLDGSYTYNWTDGTMEFYLDQPQDLKVTQHVDRQGTVTNNPNIKNVMSPDLDADVISGNTATLTFGFSGEGDLEVSLYSGCNDNMDSEPFLVPYIVFDPNSYSLLLDGNTSTLNIASQTTTYGLRNENPIRTIEVRTYERQTLLTFNVEDEQTNVADIDISSLSPGTYILKVTDDTVHYLKLVI